MTSSRRRPLGLALPQPYRASTDCPDGRSRTARCPSGSRIRNGLVLQEQVLLPQLLPRGCGKGRIDELCVLPYHPERPVPGMIAEATGYAAQERKAARLSASGSSRRIQPATRKHRYRSTSRDYPDGAVGRRDLGEASGDERMPVGDGESLRDASSVEGTRTSQSRSRADMDRRISSPAVGLSTKVRAGA